MREIPSVTEHRRIVTGHDMHKRSIVVSDEIVASAGPVDAHLWHHHVLDGSVDGTTPAVGFYPSAGEITTRFVHLPPDPHPLPTGNEAQAMSDGFFAAIGEECRANTSRHPLAHRTPTTDINIVLTSNISLVLDEGEPIRLSPYDVIIQRGTNHAWRVDGPDEGVLLAILIGRPSENGA